MTVESVEIKTHDGMMDCEFFDRGGQGAVILYMDAFGVRPAMREMAGRMAEGGYAVLLPNLYYRAGRAEELGAFDPATSFQGGPDRERLMGLYKSLTQKGVMEDTGAMLEYLDKETDGAKVGCVGYCMGGGFALSAAGTFPERVAAAASFHGARLATDSPESPHLLAPKMKGEIYVGIAGLDTHFTAQDKARLEGALAAAGVRHTVEVYEGAKHGFAVNDTPAFDKAAAEKHWERVMGLLGRNL